MLDSSMAIGLWSPDSNIPDSLPFTAQQESKMEAANEDEDGNQRPNQNSPILHGSFCSKDHNECTENVDLSPLDYTEQKGITELAFRDSENSVNDDQFESRCVAIGHGNPEKLESSENHPEVIDSEIEITNSMGSPREETGIALQFQGLYGLPKPGHLVGDTLTTSLVSSDREGWQQFYIEEAPGDALVSGIFDVTQHSHQLELWEQLLDSELHAQAKTEGISHIDLGHAYDSLQDEGSQEVLATPGNPFVVVLDRSIEFSKADSFGFQVVDHPPSDLALDPDSIRERFTSDLSGGTGMEHDQTQRELVNNLDVRLPVGDVENYQVTDHPIENSQESIDAAGSYSQDCMEVFEAPSFMTIVDQQARDLVEASMPDSVGRNDMHEVSTSAGSVDTKAPSVISENIILPHSLPSLPILNQESKQLPRQSSGVSSTSGVMNNASPRRSQSPLYGEMHNSSASPKMGNSPSPTGNPRGISSLTWLTPSLFPTRNQTITRAPQASSMNKCALKVWSTSPAASQNEIPKDENDNANPKPIWESIICCCCAI